MKWSDFVAPCTVKSAGSASGWFNRIIGRTPVTEIKVENPEPRRKAISAAKKIVRQMQAKDAARQLAAGFTAEHGGDPAMHEDEFFDMLMADDDGWEDFDRALTRGKHKKARQTLRQQVGGDK